MTIHWGLEWPNGQEKSTRLLNSKLEPRSRLLESRAIDRRVGQPHAPLEVRAVVQVVLGRPLRARATAASRVCGGQQFQRQSGNTLRRRSKNAACRPADSDALDVAPETPRSSRAAFLCRAFHQGSGK